MPEAPAAPPNAVIQSRGTLSDLDVAALTAKSFADKVAGQPDPGADSDMMKQLQASYDERTGRAAPPAEAEEAPPEKAAESPTQRPGKPPALTAPKPPVAKAKTSADWKAKEEAAEKMFNERLAKTRAEWEAGVAEQIKELQELKQWRSIIDIQNDPQFQQEFTTQQEFLTRQVKNISGEKGKELADLLSMPPSNARDLKLDELIEGLPDSSKRLVRSVQNNLIDLDLRKQMRLDQARQQANTYIERQKQQAQIEALQRKQTFSKVLDEATARGLDVFAIGTGDAKHDRQAAQLRAQAEQYFNGDGMDDHDRATIALWATLGPQYAQSYDALQQEYAQMKAKLATYESSLPGGGDDNGLEGGGRPRGKDQSQMSVEELQRDLYSKLENAQNNTWRELRKAPNVYGQ